MSIYLHLRLAIDLQNCVHNIQTTNFGIIVYTIISSWICNIVIIFEQFFRSVSPFIFKLQKSDQQHIN